MSEANPLRVSWALTTPAGIEETWALFSDTERFNRAVGFGFSFTEEPRADGTTRREGRARFLGMDVRWEELPFQYRYGQWYRWERVFQGSPASHMVGTLRLKPAGEGTAILYTIEVFPRSLLARPAVAFELNLRSKPRIDKVLREMLELLRGEPILLEPLAEPLSPEAEHTLAALLARLPDPTFAAALGPLIREAPLVEQDRISPRTLARIWHLPLSQTVQGCLSAVREGALTLGWELLCPLCLGPKRLLEHLEDVRQRVHCPACNIHFDASFSDAVAVRFRTAPALRSLQVSSACIGSPARQPHVIAQDQLPPRGSLTFALTLKPGLYRLRSFPPRDTCSLSISEEGGPSGVQIVLQEGSLLPGRVTLGAGPVSIDFSNAGEMGLLLLLERRTLPPDVLTAGQLLEVPGAAALLPEGAISPNTRTETTRCAILVIDLPNQTAAPQLATTHQHLTSAYSPRRLLLREEQLLCTFDHLRDALAAAQDLSLALPDSRVALGLGPVLDVQLGDADWIPMGQAVDRALASVWGARPGKPAVDDALVSLPELAEAIRQVGARLSPASFRVLPDLHVRRILRADPAEA